ncbi:MAG: T9SS type A sorting domain-containing protein [Bacteroidetes bacterium]|nr:T9SS type A sorting domain-containing protein [Bacteroidota bacterium]
MKVLFFCLYSFLLTTFLNAQSTVVDWTTLVNNATGIVNTSNTPNAVVTISGAGFSTTSGASPRYNASSGSTNWAMSGLGLGADWGNTSTSITVDIVFTIPVCSDLSFDIHDINGDTGTPFEDKLTVTGYDESNTLIPISSANYVFSNCPSSSICGNVQLYDAGTANSRIGRCTNGNSNVNTYGNASQKITFTLKDPSAPKKIKRVTIVYGSSSTSNTNGYMSSSSNPGYQNIVISNITAVLPPVVSTSFACLTSSSSVNLTATASTTSTPTYSWTTSTGTINSGSNTLSANVKSPATYTFTAYNGAVANGCSTQTVVTLTTTNCNLLPIELVSYSAKRINEEVKLDWQTLSEKGNDYFIVERSLNGIDFEEVKKIKGGGNSVRLINYAAIDQHPYNQITYYRLKQVDYNGQYVYSDIVSVDADNTKAFISNIYPNPTNSNFDFEFYSPINGELVYEITDYTGRVLISKAYTVESGHSTLNTIMEELPNGVYFLKVYFNKKDFYSINKIFKN